MRRFNPERELKKIQHGNKNKIFLFVISLLLVGIIGYSFALYQVRYSKRIIYTKVAPFSNNKDLNLAIYVNGKKQSIVPDKDSGYNFAAIECDDGYPVAEWDEEKWNFKQILNITVPNKCNVYFSDIIQNFKYTGGEQEFTIPRDGIYKIEVWGAKGGDTVSSIGGYGGYSVGEIYLEEKTKVYVVVGGQGKTGTTANMVFPGGYNGGGSSRGDTATAWGSGGGATHIATSTGLLSDLESTPGSVLIVAGGGGGAGVYVDINNGGHAGGYIGGTGSGKSPGYGGTQSTGGGGWFSLSGFGKGASGNLDRGGGAGGGGYYGGGGGYTLGSGGGGGSSYISPTLSNAAMYCYNCVESSDALTRTYSLNMVNAEPIAGSAKIGDGYARISYVGPKS